MAHLFLDLLPVLFLSDICEESLDSSGQQTYVAARSRDPAGGTYNYGVAVIDQPFENGRGIETCGSVNWFIRSVVARTGNAFVPPE